MIHASVLFFLQGKKTEPNVFQLLCNKEMKKDAYMCTTRSYNKTIFEMMKNLTLHTFLIVTHVHIYFLYVFLGYATLV